MRRRVELTTRVDAVDPLATALDAAITAHRPGTPALQRATRELIDVYRSGIPPRDSILSSSTAALAYAAYRMPATHAAVRAALTAVRATGHPVRPGRLLDVGGGTGAASWAAVEEFDLAEVTVLDGSAQALGLGRDLASRAPWSVLRDATWTTARFGLDVTLPPADLVTVGYVLGELPAPERDALVDACARSATDLVVIVEPGTPAGHLRVLDARDRLLRAGGRVLAPCPHQGPCPLAPDDWCHLSARVSRSALHRRLKDADRGHEDEKFSYVAVVPGPSVSFTSSADRVIRRPRSRKGLVELDLCRVDGTVGVDRVPRSRGERYRAARDVDWGDRWPQADPR